jgi:hypothetical protein
LFNRFLALHGSCWKKYTFLPCGMYTNSIAILSSNFPENFRANGWKLLLFPPVSPSFPPFHSHLYNMFPLSSTFFIGEIFPCEMGKHIRRWMWKRGNRKYQENASLVLSQIHRVLTGEHGSENDLPKRWRKAVYFPGITKQCQKIHKMVNISITLHCFPLKITLKVYGRIGVILKYLSYANSQYFVQEGQISAKKLTKWLRSPERFITFLWKSQCC